MESTTMSIAAQQAGHAFRGVLGSKKRQWKSRSQSMHPRKKNRTQHGGNVSQAAGIFDLPRLADLQRQNRIQTRKHFPKRGKSLPRKTVPSAPFNNSSYLMRIRHSQGLPTLPSPATPAVLSTPHYSPASQYREGLVEEVKDLGVNGYGSMTGLIHLRSFADESTNTTTTSVANRFSTDDMQARSGVQSVQQVEQRLAQGVSRFEMTYPASAMRSSSYMEVRLAEQESLIAHLEDENMTLKERIFLMQQEVNELRRILHGDGSFAAVADDYDDDACSDYERSD